MFVFLLQLFTCVFTGVFHYSGPLIGDFCLNFSVPSLTFLFVSLCGPLDGDCFLLFGPFIGDFFSPLGTFSGEIVFHLLPTLFIFQGGVQPARAVGPQGPTEQLSFYRPEWGPGGRAEAPKTYGTPAGPRNSPRIPILCSPEVAGCGW